ncbi:MAG: hypothetical protein JWL73_2634 [Actinomycetia bacterium]|nr:hypothetical protein [Actinomycetes bacterium]
MPQVGPVMTAGSASRLERARSWLLRASHQLLAVGVLGIVLSVAVVAGSVVSLNRADTRIERVNRSLRPSVEDLETASRSLAAEQAAIESLRPTPDLQTLDLTKLREATASTDAAWRAYRARTSPLPDATANRRTFEAAYRSYQSLQLDAISAQLAPTTTASAGTTPYASAYADSQAALVHLIRRYDDAVEAHSVDGASQLRSTRAFILGGAGAGILVFGAAFGTMFLMLRRREGRQRVESDRRDLERQRSHLDGELQQSFDMVRTEEHAFGVIESALVHASNGHDAEFLIADSSRAHFRQVVSTFDARHTGCDVGDPGECPATSQTRTMVFETSSKIAACPHLRGRPQGACSAVCVPVTIAGKSIGVIHATGPDGETPDSDFVETLSLIGRKSGDRLGTLRAFAKTEAQARTDPLTGLLNRRSLEDQVKDLIEDGHSYVVAYGDIDHFKRLNDLHGHDAGDRALRLFARVLRDSVRPSDLPARYGGEEFVVVLPDCGTDAATVVVERVREQLALHLADGRLPPFTISFGIASSTTSVLFSETLEHADQALLQAKRDGRDRIVLAPSLGRKPQPDARTGVDRDTIDPVGVTLQHDVPTRG